MSASFAWFLPIIALLLAIFAVCLLTLHKTRKVHLATYPLLADLAVVRKETEDLFGQIHAMLALERKLSLPQALPPMRGWAASPDFLHVVANEVLRRKPKTVMECSSGVSTVVVARCLQINGVGHVYSLEHDAHYAAKARNLLDQYGLSDWATVLDAPLVTQHTETPWYSEEFIPKTLDPIDVLVVDGPPSQTAPLARLPALPRLGPRMNPGGVIIVDDADRPDEQMMLASWQKASPTVQLELIPCEKGCVIAHMP